MRCGEILQMRCNVVGCRMQRDAVECGAVKYDDKWCAVMSGGMRVYAVGCDCMRWDATISGGMRGDAIHCGGVFKRGVRQGQEGQGGKGNGTAGKKGKRRQGNL